MTPEQRLREMLDEVRAKLAEPPQPTLREAVARLEVAIRQLADEIRTLHQQLHGATGAQKDNR